MLTTLTFDCGVGLDEQLPSHLPEQDCLSDAQEVMRAV